MDKYSKDKLHLLKIKSAISQFILNTQKLVQSVEPKAEIIIPSELPKKRPRSSLKDQLDHSYHITVPNYKSKRYLVRDQKN